MNVETALEFFAIVGVLALIGVTFYIVTCVVFAIIDLVWERRIEKTLKDKEVKPEVHDGSMD